MDTYATDEPPGQFVLPVVLQAAAAELWQLSEAADALGVCQATDMERWQSLDRMSQHLGELAAFLTRVSGMVPDLHPDLPDALAAIRVGKLVSRLTARPSAGDEEDAGDLEMFDV